MRIKRKKVIHKGWQRWKDFSEDTEYKKIMGVFNSSLVNKWQYLYTVEGLDMTISLVCFNTKNKAVDLYKSSPWETYNFKTEDVYRFKTKKIAEAYIKSVFIGYVDID
jgi:hypothetical protein